MVADKLAAVTVTVMLPEIRPVESVAVIVAVPGPLGVAAPPAATEITKGLLEFQVALADRFVWLVSEFVPIAVNVIPVALIGIGGRFPGVIAMLCSTTVPTYSVAGGETTDPDAAVIWVLAYPTPVATAVAAFTGFVPIAAGTLPSHTSRTM